MNKKIENKTIELKNKYCKFLDIDYFPEFKINTFDSKDSRSAFITYSKDDVPILNIKDNYISSLKDNATPIIFHEFTHIFDDYILLPELSFKEKSSLISIYSEYHAIQVQMKSSLHYAKYDSDYKFRFETKVHDWFDNKNVKEDIEFKTKDFISTIKYIFDQKETGYTYALVLHCIYYQSMCDFWKNNCKDDVTNLIKEDIPIKLFGSEFDLLHHFIINIDKTDKKYFMVLLQSQYKMIEYFTEHENNINL